MAPWDKMSVGITGSVKILLSFCFQKVSTIPTQLNKATAANTTFFRNLYLFWEDSDVEEEEDWEKSQSEMNAKLVAAKICNEKI